MPIRTSKPGPSLLLIGALIVQFSGSFLAAQTDAAPSPRISSLESTVAAIEARLQRIEERTTELRTMRRFETAINSLSGSVLPAGDEAAMAARWKDGLTFAQKDDATTLNVDLFMQTDFTWATQDDDLEDSSIGHLEDGARFRRMRFGLSGSMHRHYEWKIAFDFAQGDADLSDAYVGITGISDFLYGIRVGNVKEPTTVEFMSSAKFTTFVERGLPFALVPGRNVGLLFYGNAFEQRMSWQAGVFRDTDSFGDSSAVGTGSTALEDGKYVGTIRVTGTPIYENKGETVLHLGAWFRFANPGGDQFEVAARPEVRISPNFLRTGTFSTDDFVMAGGEIALVIDSFSVQSDVVVADFSGADSGDPEPTFWGWYVEASYFLTGERRNYKTRMGTFDRIRPASNFWDDAGGSGAWQVAARFSQLDLSDDGVDGGRLSNITVGINWYPTPNHRWLLDLTRAEVAGQDDGVGWFLTMRFQLDF
jgi:phosphate-selective porin OprO/OprP